MQEVNFNSLEANLSPPDEEGPVYHCAWGEEGIFVGDEYYDIDGEHICVSCMDNCKCTAEIEEKENEKDED